jgi:long-chain fatty acid transport protein
MHQPIRTILSLAVAGMIAHQAAHAGAFSLYTEGSAVQLGNFAAGSAAEGEDASIGWYNPAGLVLIKHTEAVISGVGVFPSTKLTGTTQYNTQNPFTLRPFPPYVQSFSGLQGGEKALVPALHIAKPLTENATFGLSVVAPFGLSTNWGTQSPLRYQATQTDLKTINVSPELGGKLSQNFSVGGGIDFQWSEVTFNTVLGSPAALQFAQRFNPLLNPTTYDSLSANKGHSFGMGFHAGALGMFNDNHTRIGVNYQSQVKHQYHGHSILSGRLADVPDKLNPLDEFESNRLFSNTATLPDITTLSLYQDVTDHVAVLGSVVYAGWRSFRIIQLNQIAAISEDAEDHALVNSTSIEDYKNTWRFALGANLRFNEAWMLRVGGGYDETPTVNAHRNVRLPDANRWAASIGAHYQMRPMLGFDLGYTYLWGAEKAKVNNMNAIGETSSFGVNALGESHVHLIGLQAVWSLDQAAPVMLTK